MIIEIAELRIKPGEEAAFEGGVARAVPLFQRAKGCRGVELHQVIEAPDVYRLVVRWETLENHMVDFRNSEDFQRWRDLVSDTFAAPPSVTHERTVDLGPRM
ncbi:antibiotic biosynthesis monooxygenase [Ancylobacter dichloromethanicus]|uniref:Antibiotic biosynthesis monooxygenase n=1 Tax=Ancylobacter dichloromethanicus TaxID=518825 RepID=A0A9W6N166_9HYPH|nr:antibiotic biosynthesis monooxygenase family protein [Ancylobacter dichloromethanicus]MBS7555206.1 antibiotic biosynthesis monooxygenase [Ancylobacter dichloromethanicus]GLK73707.1 antibiotic biosynthesis monooxygenase [Ancylobacter dichloromethanicus]